MGLRKGEILALRWSDIDGACLDIKRSINENGVETPPKNRASIRRIQIPMPLMEILLAHKERQMQLPNFNEDSKILSDGNGKILNNGTLENRNSKYAKLAELKKIRIHDFRHSHASFLAFMGINIQEIARRLGHAKIEMTWNTYSHLYPQEEERAIAVLNAMLNPYTLCA